MSHVTAGKKTETPASKKDFWNTSELALNDAKALCGVKYFALDACAKSIMESKGVDFISLEKDSLKTELGFAFAFAFADANRAVWCNPPFSKKELFLKRAKEQSAKHNLTVCCMIPFEPCTKWWRECVSDKATFVYVPDGRYCFVDDETKQEVRGVNFCSCFVVFTPLHTKEAVFINFERGFASKK